MPQLSFSVRSLAAAGVSVAALLAFAAPTFAAQSPAGCSADNSVVNIASDVSTSTAGDTITITVRAGNPTSVVDDGCDITGRTMTLTLPDGTQSVFGPFNYPNPTALEFVGSAPYVADNADAVGGFWTANVSWNGTLKNVSDVPSSGSKNAVVVQIQKGRIIVDKVTDPAADPQSFAFTTSGTGYTGFSLTDAATPNDQELDAGTYSVAETAVAGWTQTSATCTGGENPANITLEAGQTVTCTFTNTKKGHLIVEKTTVPGGSAQSFAINASGTGTITGGGAGSITDATDKHYEVTPGTYSVTETPVAGWTETSNTCDDVVVAAGETETCTITNTQQLGRIIVVKQTNPDGDLQSFEFDSNYGSNFNLADNGQNDSGELAAGTYSVAEVNIPANWALSNVTCSDGSNANSINLAAGETVTCTFTNTYTPPPPPAGEYCSPGYWKNHPQSWVGYTPNQLFSSVFESTAINWSAKGKPGSVANPTLLQALEGNGGGVTSLARAAVGALLNASAIDSPLEVADVISIFNAASPSGNLEAAKAELTFAENCPLN